MAFLILTEIACRLTRTVVFLLLAKNFGFDNVIYIKWLYIYMIIKTKQKIVIQ